jgi:hypothetical protein
MTTKTTIYEVRFSFNTPPTIEADMTTSEIWLNLFLANYLGKGTTAVVRKPSPYLS